MPKGKQNRLIVVPNAAREAVCILERLGFICMLVDEMVTYLQAGNLAPKNVKLVIVPSPSYPILPANIGELLLHEDPIHFKYPSGGENIIPSIRYYDQTGLVPAGKMNYCSVQLIAIQNPLACYRPQQVTRSNGLNLPVARMMTITVNLVSTLLNIYDSKGKATAGSSKKPRKFCKKPHLKQLKITLRACLRSFQPADLLLHPEGKILLERISSLVPDISAQVRFLIHHYQHQPALAAPSIGLSPELDNHPVRVTPPTQEIMANSDIQPPSTFPDPAPVSNKVFNGGVREIVVPNAARAAVSIVERLGFNCIVVGDFPMYLQCSGVPVPKVVRLLIIPSIPNTKPPADLNEILLRQDPTHFQQYLSGKNSKYKGIRYVDLTGLIPEDRKNFCSVEILPIRELPDYYGMQHVHHIAGIPVFGMLIVVVDLVSSILSKMESKKTTSGKKTDKQIDRQLRKQFRQLVLILDKSKMSNFTTDGAALHPDARAILDRFLRLAEPSISNQIRIFVEIMEDQTRTAMYMMDGRDPSPTPPPQDGRDPSPKPEYYFMDGRDPSPTPSESESVAESSICSALEPASEPAPLNQSNPSRSSFPSSATNFEDGPVRQGISFSDGPNTHTEVIYCIANEVVRILHRLDINCAIFGSTACTLYGNERPWLLNDIDILAFPSSEIISEASIKQAIVEADENFFLEKSKHPGSTYQILYYRVIKGSVPNDICFGKKCKVDIFIPGIMNLPKLSTTQTALYEGLPVVPFDVLLLLKLQAWNDHRQGILKGRLEPGECGKKKVHMKDVKQLLTLDEHINPLVLSQPWNDRDLFSEKFRALSAEAVKNFCQFNPEYKSKFVLLGFSL